MVVRRQNEDLRPVEAEKRTWRGWNFVTLSVLPFIEHERLPNPK